MIQGEGRGNSGLLPKTLFVVKKRLWSSIRIISLAMAAKKGLVENRNHIATFAISLKKLGMKLLEVPSMPMKERKMIKMTKDNNIDA